MQTSLMREGAGKVFTLISLLACHVDGGSGSNSLIRHKGTNQETWAQNRRQSQDEPYICIFVVLMNP